MVGLGRVGRERWVGAAWGALFTGILAILIVVGSRNLQHFDAALVGTRPATNSNRLVWPSPSGSWPSAAVPVLAVVLKYS